MRSERYLKINLITSCLASGICVIFIHGGISNALSSHQEDFVFTSEESKALQEFRKDILPIIPKKSFVKLFVRDDLFLVRWLRAHSLNVPLAEREFFECLYWRDSENIDNIDNNDLKDWRDFQEKFPVFMDTFDKEGRPIAEIFLSEWETRAAIKAGKGKLLLRWLTRILEIQMRRLAKIREDGGNATRTILLIDADGFDLVHNGCYPCVMFYVTFGMFYEMYYPDSWESVYLVNCNNSMNSLLKEFRPKMSSAVNAAVRAFTSRQKQLWMYVLNSKIEKSNRSTRFGGTIKRP